MNVLEVKDVYKHLGKREVIKGISFSVKEGEIFGFLGPNGAGKTTTIRMLVGLIAPNNGSISIMGNDIQSNRVKALNEVGAVVENPELYTYMSGRENLKQIAAIRKISKNDIEDVVSMVNLSGRINDKVKKYSLGMKQRLGLAAALLSKPKLLILDEPTNGLDPTGILDFRGIVKKAAKERGTAIFVSSHMLSEIEQICDTVAFINDGVIKSIESVLGTEENEINQQIVLVTEDHLKCVETLQQIDFVKILSIKQNTFNLKIEAIKVPELIFILAANNIPIKEVYEKHSLLEQRYIELVEGGRR
jgi:ABC-2 type transport system ATP-binding protein